MAIKSDGSVITWGGEEMSRTPWAGNEDGFLGSSNDEFFDEDWTNDLKKLCILNMGVLR